MKKNEREEALRAKALEIARSIKAAISPLQGVGFALFVFDQNNDATPGWMTYLSSGQRDSMLVMLEEWLILQKALKKTPGQA